MDRRSFIASAATAALAAGLRPAGALAQAASPAPAGSDAALNALFDRIFEDTLDHSPQFCTALGYDKGARAAAKGRLDDNSEAEMRGDLARTRAWLATLEAFPVDRLSEAAALNREIVLYSLRNATVAPGRFEIDSVIRPYRIFQQGGAYFSVPDFLNDAHVIADRADCDAYLARLDAFAGALDVDTEVQRARSGRGFTAPDFSIDLTIGQLENLNYWVDYKTHDGRIVWEADDIPLEEAIGHFLRIRREREVGYDIEVDLNPGLGHIGPR